jgi:nicotinamidase-related amidase
MTRRIFFDIDTQNAFFAEDTAKVYIDPLVVTRIKKLVKHAITERTPIIGTVQTHETGMWFANQLTHPDLSDCDKGTWNWLKLPDTLPPRSLFVSNLQILPDASTEVFAQGHYLEKSEHGVFGNVHAEALIENLTGDTNEEVEFVVFGYNVKETAVDLLTWRMNVLPPNRKVSIKVVSNAIVYPNKLTQDSDKELMEASGIEFVEASVFIGDDVKPSKKFKNKI